MNKEKYVHMIITETRNTKLCARVHLRFMARNLSAKQNVNVRFVGQTSLRIHGAVLDTNLQGHIII